MAPRHAPMFVGVEDTNTVAAAHGRSEPKLNLESFRAHVDALVRQGLGNLYALRGYMLHPDADSRELLKAKQCVTDDPEGDLVKLLEYAAKRGVYTMTIYTAMTKRVVSALKRKCGKYYLGNNLGESVNHTVPPGQPNMRAAAQAYVRHVARMVRGQWSIGQPHVMCTLGSLREKYCMEAGMDVAMAEIFTLPSVDVQYAMVRGAARGYEKDLFGGWIATGWFSGNNHDPLKPRRWRLALNAGFLHGCQILIQESGHWGLYEFRDFEDQNHPLCRKYRTIQREFCGFARANPRPARGPTVNVGLVHGHLDGYTGREGHVWDQPGWPPSYHEWSWELLNVFYPAMGRLDNSGVADRRHPRFSGTPYGLADLVPAEASVEALSRYRSLLFLGSNTMTAAHYRNLMAYVRGGGRLVMWGAQLNASAEHLHEDPKIHLHRFYRNGDFMDLFGARVRIAPRPKRGVRWRPESTMVNTVRWVQGGAHRFPIGKTYYINWPHGGVESTLAPGVKVLAVTDRGQPFVTEHKLGKGRAILVHGYSSPGHASYRELAEDICRAVGRRELSSFRVEGNPKLSYAVYGRGKRRTLYVVNSDLERRQRGVITGLSDGPGAVTLAPAQLKRVDWQ